MAKVIRRIENGVISARTNNIDEIGFIVSTAEPTSQACGAVWIDISTDIPTIKIYDCNVPGWGSPGGLPIGVYYLGGNTSTSDGGAGANSLKTIERLSSDTVCATITATLPMSTGSWYHSSERLGSIIYMTGGYQEGAGSVPFISKLYSDTLCKTSAIKHDPARLYQSSGVMAGAAYFFGGDTLSGQTNEIRKLIQDDTWSVITATIPTIARREMSAAPMNSKLYTMGGMNTTGPNWYNNIDRLDSDSSCVASAAVLTTSRAYTGSASYSSRIYTAGGWDTGWAWSLRVDRISGVSSSEVCATANQQLTTSRIDTRGAAYAGAAYFLGSKLTTGTISNAIQKVTGGSGSETVATITATLVTARRYGSATSVA